jgi:ribulose 1,5-bisphosphate synthetase/thiazole synthase
MEKRKATIGILLLSIGCYYLFRTISIMKQNENIIIAFNSTTLILIIIPLLLLVFVFRYYKHKNKNENKTDIAGEEDKYINRAKRMVSRWSGKQQQINRKNPINEMILNRNSITQDYSSFVNETSKSIPIFAECDVLVVGGGPSGISAALAAKRAGADTILLEKFGCFGGVITTVGMETIGWYRYEGTVESQGGIGIEMERIATKMGGTIKWPYNDSQCLDADYFKIVADHLLTEAGVRPILHCLAVEVMLENNQIIGIITESKSGRLGIRAKRVIDCTGDADIAHLAGCSYRKTPKDEMLGVSTIFSCSNIDKERFLKYTEDNPATYSDWGGFWIQETSGKENHLRTPYLDKEFQQAKELGIIPKTSSIGGSWSSLTDAGEATNLNLVYMKNYDCTDVNDLTKAEMEGRKETLHAIMALRHVVPGFEKAKLRNFGMTLGGRDSRKIIGRYSLTEDDVKNQAKFTDSVGIFPEFIDGYNVIILPTTGRYFEVPYGCLVPLEIDNLLVAGRCVAGDKISHAAMRNMAACTVTGQGAGVAAAISLKQGVTTSEVDIQLVQNELIRQGVRIH